MSGPYRSLPVARNACTDCKYNRTWSCTHESTRSWDRVAGHRQRLCKEIRHEQSTDACPYFEKGAAK